jgi:hypothetical protein
MFMYGATDYNCCCSYVTVINIRGSDAHSFKSRLCDLVMDLLLPLFLLFFISSFILAGYDSEEKRLMQELGVDEQLASLTSIPPTKSALDVWQVL